MATSPAPLIARSRDHFGSPSTPLYTTHVEEADIKAGFRTDHFIITLSLGFGKEPKRSLLWQFNSSLLKDTAFVQEMNEVINVVIQEYAAFPYCRDKLREIPRFEVQFVISDQLLLDALLVKVRIKVIYFASKKKRENEEKENIYNIIFSSWIATPH